MTRQLPSFPALRAFEAAARHLSFKAAADELCLTQSAISHQIKLLESFVGSPLFIRGPQKVRLTGSGTEYQRQITPLINGIEAATLSIKDKTVSGQLNIQVSPSFSENWLLRRIKKFGDAWPDIELNIVTGEEADSVENQPFDIRINCGLSMPPSAEEEAFMSSPRVPVCSPELLKDGPEIGCYKDILHYPLLRELDYDSWDEWFSNVGFSKTPKFRSYRLENAQMTLKAAEEGQGITLGHTALIERELENGTLVQLFDTATAPYVIWTITCPVVGIMQPKVTAFREWLVNEAGEHSEMSKPTQFKIVEA
jgi:LysR family glycine cleavage system transcriptional activator